MARILIVENNQDIRDLFQHILSPEHQILEATNGREAIEIFKHYQPDIVITHYTIPEIDGIELVSYIRSLSRNVKIIAYSGHFAYQAKCSAMFAAGADRLLRQPIDMAQIEQSVAEFVGL